MELNLQDYVQKIKLFTEDECDDIVNVLEAVNSWREYPYDSPEDNICVQETPDVSYYDCRLPEDNRIREFMHTKIEAAVDSHIHDFLSELPWFSYWTGYGNLNFIKYPTDTGMDTHCDHVRNQFDGSRRGIPILTVLGSLNDSYEGGELLFWNKDIIELRTGEVLIFPSNYLFPHKVKVVKKGMRYSFVNWIW
tara:strand:+ start:489 stop:1067 length:579 start_codon:yes stop_codon:yes gene_type:complete